MRRRSMSGLLPARRDGEPDQGVPTRSVCRSNAGGNAARQSAPALVRGDGLRPHVRAAPDRAGRHRAGAGHLRTIRLKLLKIGAQVTISARRVRIACASAYPSGASSPSPTRDSDGPAAPPPRPPDPQQHRNIVGHPKPRLRRGKDQLAPPPTTSRKSQLECLSLPMVRSAG